MTVAILITCLAMLVIASAFLLYQGRFGQRGIIWVRDE